MEGQEKIIRMYNQKNNIRTGAKIALIVLLLNVIKHLVAIYQTRYQLITPLIHESTIWEINKQFVYHATVSACASVGGLFLYFFNKYLLVIILVGLMLIADRFIYV